MTRATPRGPRIALRAVRERANRMLADLGESEAELSVVLTDDRRIHALNREHRRKDKPTDVLAFPMDAGVRVPGAPRLLGDVVVSLETAREQARSRGATLLSEVTHLLAHGLLHLLGHDHRTDAEERRMNRRASRLVAAAARGARTNLVRRIRDPRLTSRSR